MFLSAAAFALASGLFVAGSGAQSSSSSSSSASGSNLLAQDRTARATDWIKKLSAFKTVEQTYRSARVNFFQKRADNARTCRDLLRRSNRDQLIVNATNCYRTALTLEKDFRLRERDELLALPGISDKIRAATVKTLDSLITAMNAILSGLSSDVYVNVDEMIEAKNNLTTRYRAPFAAAMLTLRADWLTSWADYLLSRVAGDENEVARACLEDADVRLRAIASGKESPADRLASLHAHLLSCAEMLASEAATESGSTK
jgi:hypothetical protein